MAVEALNLPLVPSVARRRAAVSPGRSAMRGGRRYPHEVVCRVDVEGLGRTELDCVNLSAFGAFLRTPVCPDEGTRVRCAIPLPDDGVWIVAGRIVRVALDEGGEAGIAVAFDGVSSRDRQRLSMAFAEA